MPKITVPAALQKSVAPLSRSSIVFGQTDRAHWSLQELTGRLTELSGMGAGAQLSLAFSLVRQAQAVDDPVAWVTTRESAFFPPDAFANQIDLDRLVVVFVPDATAMARSADRLLRSAGFGLVVLDMVGVRDDVPPALSSRLSGLALQHGSVALCLTDKPAQEASLGPLVSLRCQAMRQIDQQLGDRLGDVSRPSFQGRQRFQCTIEAIKDKRRGPGWIHQETHHGPLGLR